ncbi:MAG: hypothetical protein KatS3mg064_1789 [Tepidiforma sp.]|nr:MAG: hypothetical protein KatS3mg064_1789 [Tepidiforma sp.]
MRPLLPAPARLWDARRAAHVLFNGPQLYLLLARDGGVTAPCPSVIRDRPSPAPAKPARRPAFVGLRHRRLPPAGRRRPCPSCARLPEGGADVIELGVPFSDPHGRRRHHPAREPGRPSTTAFHHRRLLPHRRSARRARRASTDARSSSWATTTPSSPSRRGPRTCEAEAAAGRRRRLHRRRPPARGGRQLPRTPAAQARPQLRPRSSPPPPATRASPASPRCADCLPLLRQSVTGTTGKGNVALDAASRARVVPGSRPFAQAEPAPRRRLRHLAAASMCRSRRAARGSPGPSVVGSAIISGHRRRARWRRGRAQSSSGSSWRMLSGRIAARGHRGPQTEPELRLELAWLASALWAGRMARAPRPGPSRARRS